MILEDFFIDPGASGEGVGLLIIHTFVVVHMLLTTHYYYYFALCYAILLYCRYSLGREIFSKMMYSCLSRCCLSTPSLMGY